MGDYVEGSVARVLKSGGGIPVTLVGGVSQPNSIAVDDTSIYWSNYGDDTVMRALKVGGPTAVLGTGQPVVGNVRVLGGYVLWKTCVGFCSIMRISSSAVDTPKIVLWSDTINGFALGASSCTWLDGGENAVVRSALVGDPPTVAGSPAVIASAQEPPRAVAVDAFNAYWVTEGAFYQGSIMQAPLDGSSAPITLVPQLPPSNLPRYFIAADDTFVYWTDRGSGAQSDGRVARVPIGGGDIEVLADAQAGPLGIAVDDSAVYWTNMDDGTVRRKPKP
jgi:hypothetical protein